MPSGRSSPRNHRNSPYMIDEMLVRAHHSAAGVLWRFRTELASLAVTTTATWQLALVIGAALALAILGVLITAALAIPPARRFVLRRVWCVISRHRLQKMFYETRMHTRSGRLSLVLRIHPTEVGEKALIWCRAGICFEDFEAHTGEIAAACYAREARIERSKRWAQLVQVNIVRRDTLAAHNIIASGLAAKVPRGATVADNASPVAASDLLAAIHRKAGLTPDNPAPVVRAP